jgi:D-tyrosyl-tRNA(Tyr) deacylase
MRAVVQRVRRARVTVEGTETGSIGEGLLILAGFRASDSEAELEWMAKKCANLRIFEDEAGKMNRSVLDIGGGVLVVSQFTLYGDAAKGNRPSFIDAARPELAEPLYERFCVQMESLLGKKVGRGRFAANMDVELTNQGPVTILLDREAD